MVNDRLTSSAESKPSLWPIAHWSASVIDHCWHVGHQSSSVTADHGQRPVSSRWPLTMAADHYQLLPLTSDHYQFSASSARNAACLPPLPDLWHGKHFSGVPSSPFSDDHTFNHTCVGCRGVTVSESNCRPNYRGFQSPSTPWQHSQTGSRSFPSRVRAATFACVPGQNATTSCPHLLRHDTKTEGAFYLVPLPGK